MLILRKRHAKPQCCELFCDRTFGRSGIVGVLGKWRSWHPILRPNSRALIVAFTSCSNPCCPLVFPKFILSPNHFVIIRGLPREMKALSHGACPVKCEGYLTGGRRKRFFRFFERSGQNR